MMGPRINGPSLTRISSRYPATLSLTSKSAAGPNLTGNAFYIDNPALNGQPGLVLNVTPNTSAGNVANPHPIGVVYDGSRNMWAVFNQDSAPMPADAAFNIQAVNP